MVVEYVVDQACAHRRVNRWFSNAFESETSTRENRLCQLKNNFRANSSRGASTYQRVMDCREGLALLKIPHHVIRGMKVKQITELVANKPDSFTVTIIRLSVHLEWDNLAAFYERRLRIDKFSRLLLTALAKNPDTTLQMIRTTTAMTNKQLTKVLDRNVDIRLKLADKMSTFHIDEVIHRLQDKPMFQSWLTSYHFTGTLGGGKTEEDKEKRTAGWLEQQYYADMKKRGVDVKAWEAAKNVSINVAEVPDSVDVSMNTKGKKVTNVLSVTGESSTDDSEDDMTSDQCDSDDDCTGEREQRNGLILAGKRNKKSRQDNCDNLDDGKGNAKHGKNAKNAKDAKNHKKSREKNSSHIRKQKVYRQLRQVSDIQKKYQKSDDGKQTRSKSKTEAIALRTRRQRDKKNGK